MIVHENMLLGKMRLPAELSQAKCAVTGLSLKLGLTGAWMAVDKGKPHY